MCCVHGFTPYFYVALPPSTDLSEGALGQLRTVLDQRVRERARGDEKRLSSFVLGITKIKEHQSLLGYHFDARRDFIKVRKLALLIIYLFLNKNCFN